MPQALPPLVGSPIDFIREVLKFKSHKDDGEHTGEMHLVVA